MSMSPFRQVTLVGPEFSAKYRLWRADVVLGAQSDKTDAMPTHRNFSIRLLAQEVRATETIIVGEASPGGVKTRVQFHQPLLLAAAAIGADSDNKNSIAILGASFAPAKLSGEYAWPRYSELRVAPVGSWPDVPFSRDESTDEFEITAPELRTTTGAIRVGCLRSGSATLTQRLSMNWDQPNHRARIFGCLEIDVAQALGNNGSAPHANDAIVIDLVPEGVEFDLYVPDPFFVTTLGEDIPMLGVRVRLVAIQGFNRTDLRLDLVGGDSKSLTTLSAGLAWMSRDLAADGGNIALQIDARGVPPLSWPLTASGNVYTCGAPGLIPEVRLREDAIGIKLLTRTEPDGGEPGVAELARHFARLARRKPTDKFTLEIRTDPFESAAPPPVDAPTATLAWDVSKPIGTYRNPDAVKLAGFSGVARADGLGERLSKLWSASGAIATSSWPRFAFLALERGWVQIPLPAAPSPGAPPTRRASGLPSAFAGFFRVDIPLGDAHGESASAAVLDGSDLPSLVVVASSHAKLTITWDVPLKSDTARKIVAELSDCFGTVDGILWAGEGSPTPAEILPPRDSGPAAMISVPIVFGARDAPGWPVTVGPIDRRMPASVAFKSPVVVPPDDDPLLLWRPHPELALVSSTAMTRTAASGTRPSATRDLIPTALPRDGVLTLSFHDHRLPDVSPPAGTTPHGDGRWGWPWPPETASAGMSASSPKEKAGVALAALTLPGVEFSVGPDATGLGWDSTNRASLRFDLPLLDELFANAKAPDPTIASAKKISDTTTDALPTALDPRRLADAWIENARRLARARTEADRIVLDESVVAGKAAVRVWHPTGEKLVTGRVRGLVEPYVWHPEVFEVLLKAPSVSLHLGAYRLGGADDDGALFSGGRALDGLRANFTINGELLVKDGIGVVRIDGFASSSFISLLNPPAAGEVVQLQDARGLSLARDPALEPAISARAQCTVRRVKQRGESGEQGLSLATLVKPIDLKIGTANLQFWFRDLPLARADVYSFDRTGGLETGGGPDPRSIDRDHLVKTLYEWRFYSTGHDADTGRFDIPLTGSFRARPLRLLAFEMSGDGSPKMLQILASVSLMDVDEAEREDGAPFGPEDVYASGNLVVLQFDDAKGKKPFEFRSIRHAQIGAPPSDPFPPTQANLRFRDVAHVASKSTAPITLGITLKADGDKIVVASPNLAVRLFGQASVIALANWTDDGSTITATAEGNPQDSVLQLKKITFEWQHGKHPVLQLKNARLCAPLRGTNPRAPFAAIRDYGAAAVQWLGLTTHPDVADKEIDHDSGVVRFVMKADVDPDVDDRKPALFRGFLLPKGSVRGVFVFVFTRNAMEAPGAWPVAALGSAYIEMAFDAMSGSTTQRITSIRHRHVYSPDRQNGWMSSLRFDAEFSVLDRSTIQWPINCAEIVGAGSNLSTGDEARAGSFDADSEKPGDWSVKLKMEPKGALALVHTARPRLCAHSLPLDLLVAVAGDGDGDVVLGAPWRFRALVDHELKPGDGQFWPNTDQSSPIAWKSIDELCLVDLSVLAQEAWSDVEKPGTDTRYAFMPRYVRPGGADVRIAGVVRRTLANAGFPVRALLTAIGEKYPKGSKVNPALVLTGARLSEAVFGEAAAGKYAKVDSGVAFVSQWILPWAQDGNASNIQPLDSIPQTPDKTTTYDIATYDAAAKAPRRLDGASAIALAAQDGTQDTIESLFALMVGTPSAKTGAVSTPRADYTIVVDQAFAPEPVDTSNPLAAPIFLRTLLALKTVAANFSKGPRLRCVAPSQGAPHREIRFVVGAWAPGSAPGDTPDPCVSLLAADERRISIEVLPVQLSSALSDPASNELDLRGPQRAEAAIRALSLSDAPRAVVLARVDSSYLTIYNGRPAADATTERSSIVGPMDPFPHVDWVVAPAPLPGLAGIPPIALRDATVTIHASPALGWPKAPEGMDVGRLQARLGDEAVRRNTERAWAGRARSLSWPAIALPVPNPETPDPRDEVATAAFVSMGQRTAFRRLAARNLRSPPDRQAVIAPPRARAPTIESLVAAFEPVRMPAVNNTTQKDQTRLAPLLPGPIEVTVTGQRAGVLITLHEGILTSSMSEVFDRDFARFGRPADRGPLIVRQLRAPRSSALPNDQELDRRRRTFVAGDDRLANHLVPFRLIRGPAIVARYRLPVFTKPDPDSPALPDPLDPRSILFKFEEPSGGLISPTWEGALSLSATVPTNDTSARLALACIGMIPLTSAGVMKHAPHASLQVGGVTVTLDQLTWCEKVDSESHAITSQVALTFAISDVSRRRDACGRIVAALRDSSADTPIRFTVRCGSVDSKDLAGAPSPASIGTIALQRDDGPKAASVPAEDLIPGPPHVLSFVLPHIPARRRWLPLATNTLVFGDPAYDRELGSPVRNNVFSIDNVPHVLAVDRAEYDLGSTLHFAFWMRTPRKAETSAAPKSPAEVEAPPGTWTLGVQVIPAARGDARNLAIAATTSTGITYNVLGHSVYAISIASLREVAKGTGGVEVPQFDQPARLFPGDRLRLSVALTSDPQRKPSLSVTVGVVAEPVLPPPAAVYGLVSIRDSGPAVATELFATAPLPQTIDFPNLLQDLVDGHVRRRALFVWPFMTLRRPPRDAPYGSLVKVDRSGGGQLPESIDDFRALE